MQSGTILHPGSEATMAGTTPNFTERLDLALKSPDLETHLEARGSKAVETALREWSIQLAHEHPCHILAPALHKTREQIAEVIGKESGQDLSNATAVELAAVARKQLREQFINADMG